MDQGVTPAALAAMAGGKPVEFISGWALHVNGLPGRNEVWRPATVDHKGTYHDRGLNRWFPAEGTTLLQLVDSGRTTLYYYKYGADERLLVKYTWGKGGGVYDTVHCAREDEMLELAALLQQERQGKPNGQ